VRDQPEDVGSDHLVEAVEPVFEQVTANAVLRVSRQLVEKFQHSEQIDQAMAAVGCQRRVDLA
jgi:hypothetical protein